MIQITAEAAVDALRAVVDRVGPDQRYDGPRFKDGSPRYFTAGAPCCLLGHTITELGGTVSDVVERTPIGRALKPTAPITWNDEAAALLEEVQLVHDDGATWGRCLAVAITWLESLTESGPALHLSPAGVFDE